MYYNGQSSILPKVQPLWPGIGGQRFETRCINQYFINSMRCINNLQRHLLQYFRQFRFTVLIYHLNLKNINAVHWTANQSYYYSQAQVLVWDLSSPMHQWHCITKISVLWSATLDSYNKEEIWRRCKQKDTIKLYCNRIGIIISFSVYVHWGGNLMWGFHLITFRWSDK